MFHGVSGRRVWMSADISPSPHKLPYTLVRMLSGKSGALKQKQGLYWAQLPKGLRNCTSASQVLKQVCRKSLHHYLTAAGMMSSVTAAHLVFPLLAEVALMSEKMMKMVSKKEWGARNSYCMKVNGTKGEVYIHLFMYSDRAHQMLVGNSQRQRIWKKV